VSGGGQDRPLAALTGATGFLGSHIADALLAEGGRVRAAVRPTSDLRWLAGKDLECVEAALTPPPDRDDDADAESLDAFLDGARTVIHCAGVVRAPDEAGYHRGNVLSTRRLLEAAARSGSVTAFVLISSLAAGGPAGPDAPRHEADPCEPITAYGRSKVQAEGLLGRNWPFRTTALRPPALYGPRDSAFLPLFQAARRGWSAELGNVAALSLVDGRDAARAAVLLAADERARGPWYVDGGPAVSFRELAHALELAFGRRVRTLRIPAGLLRAAAKLVGRERAERLPVLAEDRLRDAEAPGWVCDGGRLREELGFAPERTLDEGLAQTLLWYRNEGWLG
jgi:nucleoside-diphosphate-sugar epimerase